MKQTSLHEKTIYDALGTAVKAAGGSKKVGAKLWPELSSTEQAKRMDSCLNPRHQQKLSPVELLLVAKAARDAGDNSVMEFLGCELANEVKPLSPEEAKKQARNLRALALLEELRRVVIEE